MHFALKRKCFLRELDYSMRSPSYPFVITPNKLLIAQVNDSCMHFIPHNPYIYIYDVGLVNEKKKKIANLGPSGVKINVL